PDPSGRGTGLRMVAVAGPAGPSAPGRRTRFSGAGGGGPRRRRAFRAAVAVGRTRVAGRGGRDGRRPSAVRPNDRTGPGRSALRRLGRPAVRAGTPADRGGRSTAGAVRREY